MLGRVKRVYSFWGRFPNAYAAQDFITFMGKPHYIRKRAVEMLNLRKGDKALEVACGTGRNFPYIMEAIGKKGMLVGFDYSKEMLDSARKLCERKGWKNVKLYQGDAAELKIKENNFNGILSVLGISALPEWEKALKRCKELLRKRGILAVCDARPFGGRLGFLNPLVKAVYSNLAAWGPSKDIPAKMKEIFGNVETKKFNLGTIFIATSAKK